LGKFVIKNVDHIILLTGAYKELFLSKGVRNISVIPPFIRYPEEISSAEKKDIREKYKIGEDKIWVFSISRIIRHKGIQFFINALPGILDKHSSVRFMVAGGGDYIGKLKEYVEVLDLKDRVKFLGRVSEREKEVLYRLSDVFTLLSFSSESFGITLAEAMQAGLPILASNKGAVPYVVKDGRNGVIVDPFDKKQIIEGFSAVLENKEKYSTQNIEDSKQYTPEVVISKIEKVYEEVINED
jgi:glycosyltransferase involved in cell wall biosynthesis